MRTKSKPPAAELESAPHVHIRRSGERRPGSYRCTEVSRHRLWEAGELTFIERTLIWGNAQAIRAFAMRHGRPHDRRARKMSP